MWNRTFLSKNATVSCKHFVEMSFFLLLNLRGVHALGKEDGHMTWGWKSSAGHLNAKFMSCAVNFEWMVMSSSKRVNDLRYSRDIDDFNRWIRQKRPFSYFAKLDTRKFQFQLQQKWCLFRINIIWNHTVELLQLRILPTSEEYKHLFDPT